MKTPMNVFNTVMKKKKKNRKGFSLVELIVVLVIMAILAAALVPTLVGYIKQTRQSNAKNEAASCVSAAQTIASSAFAAGTYTGNGSGNTVTLTFTGDVATTSDGAKMLNEIESLAEVKGGTVIAVTIGGSGSSTAGEAKVVDLVYDDGTTAVHYNGSKYEADATGSYTDKKTGATAAKS
ncbi:type II secretion system protein [Ruminococcus callidus]|uniref:type II secretion system protein n=1 Tax=Ruminococcus callidus TaxID=40519 RepID=UPI003FD8F0EF